MSLGLNPARTPLLSVQGLSAGYGSAEAVLQSIDLELDAGEIRLVLGPNGAGKSTLLKAIAGLISIRSGHIRMAEQDITGLSPRKVSQCGIAFVPQENNVFSSLSVQDNLEVAGIGLRKSRQGRILDVFNRVPELGRRPGIRAGALSGGQRQLLAMGMALMVSPKLLLLDEPSAGLSPIASERLFENIRSIRQEGVSILLVEQRVQQACEVADSCLVMQEGAITWQGPTAEFVSNKDVSRLFLGLVLGNEQFISGGNKNG